MVSAAASLTRIRAAFHVHSDWSYDGRWSLEALSAGFRRCGYDVVLLAEHDRGFDEARWTAYRRACAYASRGGPLLVPGIEYSDATNTTHVPVWGAEHFLGEALATRELLPRVREIDGIAVLAHPVRRSAGARLDPGLLDHFAGVELWNRKYDGYAPSDVGAALLRRRPGLQPVVSLDFHTARQFFPLAMVLSLDGDGDMTVDRVLDAVRRGRADPRAFGVPAMDLATGSARTAMCGVERARRGVAGQLRRGTRRRVG